MMPPDALAVRHYHIHHLTGYRYSLPVRQSRQVLRMAPRALPWQHCHDVQIQVEPLPDEWFDLDDFFGNRVTQFALHHPHDQLQVAIRSSVSVTPRYTALQATASLPWEDVRQQLTEGGPQVLDPVQYLFPSPYIPVSRALAAWAQPSFEAGRPLLEAVLDFNARLFADMTFDPEATTLSTPVETVFQEKKGVCQDFSHLQIACLRSLGLAARYVSGYILTEPPPGQPRLIGADASHAWVSVWCPPFGWVDIDPTNNLLVDNQHITVAWGRDFGDISPLHGIIVGGGQHQLDVQVTVTPVAAGTPLG